MAAGTEEDTELRDLLVQTLESSGVLNKIKVRRGPGTNLLYDAVQTGSQRPGLCPPMTLEGARGHGGAALGGTRRHFKGPPTVIPAHSALASRAVPSPSGRVRGPLCGGGGGDPGAPAPHLWKGWLLRHKRCPWELWPCWVPSINGSCQRVSALF